jgi:ribosomal protein S18 acetylase RimI-like enzyme
MNDIPPFPARPGPGPATPGFLRERGFMLRHAVDADIPRLKVLYADTRAEELAVVPWPQEVRQGFLDQQFRFQHLHYLRHHPEADFLVIEHEGVVQGRYYVQRTAPEHLIIDICLMAGHRGRGLGRALIEDSMRGARALGHGMCLQVLVSNTSARRLYEALGFVIGGGTQTHHHMRWADGSGGSVA